jgi:hypothetical protein
MTDPTYYPEWFYYPSRTRPPDWVHQLLEVVAAARPMIDSATVDGLTSDKALAHLRPKLLKLGYEVEGGKHRAEKIRRPVLFGDQGRERGQRWMLPCLAAHGAWWPGCMGALEGEESGP